MPAVSLADTDPVTITLDSPASMIVVRVDSGDDVSVAIPALNDTQPDVLKGGEAQGYRTGYDAIRSFIVTSGGTSEIRWSAVARQPAARV